MSALPLVVAPSVVTSRVRVVSTGVLAAVLLALFVIDNIVLLGFLGAPAPLVATGAVAIAAGMMWLGHRLFRNMPEIPVSTVAAAIALAAVLLVLGGEGRVFFANADWQIRDAVLADMAGQPWPFAYDRGGEAHILRAPLGMYLLPALAGPGAELALLASNAVRLGLCFALAWPLFDSRKARAISFGIFLLFSGWDVVGATLMDLLDVKTNWDELEIWNFGYQYSSHLTQLFWVPQHALAGWLCAVTFLLWRRGQAPVGLFAATIPLMGIWSPLAVIGAIPFAALAGIATLRRRDLKTGDVTLAALAVVTSFGALLYMQLDAAAVGGGIRNARPSVYVLCAMLEVVPFIYPLLREGNLLEHDRPVLWLVLGFLLVVPIFQIGQSADLQMRASIMPLAILAIAFAGWTVRVIAAWPARRTAAKYALAALLIGSVTPLNELRRTLTHETSPPPLCSLVDVWLQQTGMIVPISTYLARTSALPTPLRDVPITVREGASGPCWARPWPAARPWIEREPRHER